MPSPLAGSVGILGGSFNPVHNGHLRLAVEIREVLGLSRVDLLPARMPPHKNLDGLLDFQCRLDLLLRAVEGVQGIGVCDLEGQMPVPSYSHATLTRLRELHPEVNYVFILGGTDLLTLPSWHRGLEIPLLADIAVAERFGADAGSVERFLDTHWTWIKDKSGVRRIAGGRRVVFVTVPRLDISSSMVRDKFCAGREISALVPERVRDHLLAAPQFFADRWATTT